MLLFDQMRYYNYCSDFILLLNELNSISHIETVNNVCKFNGTPLYKPQTFNLSLHTAILIGPISHPCVCNLVDLLMTVYTLFIKIETRHLCQNKNSGETIRRFLFVFPTEAKQFISLSKHSFLAGGHVKP